MQSPRPRDRRTWRDTLRYLLLQRDTPESIALGVALGTFIAMTPTLGVQIILALAAASLLNANRLAALPPLAITNALTAGPIYGLECWIGAQFLPRTCAADLLERWALLRDLIARRDFHAYLDHWRDVAKIGWDLWLAMWIGSLLVGGVMAIAAYWLTLAIVRAHRRRRAIRLRGSTAETAQR
ncbi:MAG: DUF2062 domain-containing protein [Kiritimatiellae bacterium]|nr:DUF2062 domain-containing protein [Kiritimatiellia bacterium]